MVGEIDEMDVVVLVDEEDGKNELVEVAEVDVNEVVEGDRVDTEDVVVGVDEEDKISNLE